MVDLLQCFERIMACSSAGVKFDQVDFDKKFTSVVTLLERFGIPVTSSQAVVASCLQEPGADSENRFRRIGQCVSLLQGQAKTEVTVNSVMKLVHLMDSVATESEKKNFCPADFDVAYEEMLSCCLGAGMTMETACQQLHSIIPGGLVAKARMQSYYDLAIRATSASDDDQDMMSANDLVKLGQSMENMKAVSLLADAGSEKAFVRSYLEALLVLDKLNVHELGAARFIKSCLSGSVRLAGRTYLDELEEVLAFLPMNVPVGYSLMVTLMDSLEAYKRLKKAASSIERKDEARAALVDMLAIGMERPDCIDCQKQVKLLQKWVANQECSGELFQPGNNDLLNWATWQTEYYSSYLKPVFKTVSSCEAEFEKQVKKALGKSNRFDVQAWLEHSGITEKALKDAFIYRAGCHKSRACIVLPDGFQMKDYACKNNPVAVPAAAAINDDAGQVVKAGVSVETPLPLLQEEQSDTTLMKGIPAPPGPPPGFVRKSQKRATTEEDSVPEKKTVTGSFRTGPASQPGTVDFSQLLSTVQLRKTDISSCPAGGKTADKKEGPGRPKGFDQILVDIRSKPVLKKSSDRNKPRQLSAAEQKQWDDKTRQAAKKGLDNTLTRLEQKRDDLEAKLCKSSVDAGGDKVYKLQLAKTNKEIKDFFEKYPGFVKGPLTEEQLAKAEKKNIAYLETALKRKYQSMHIDDSEVEEDNENWD